MHILIDIARQTLDVYADDTHLLRRYPVSTAARGAGEQMGSYQTPRGRHVIRAKIGAGLPEAAVLKGRRPTGEICTPQRVLEFPERDWILSRILWLSGCQPGFNRLGARDTMARYIYIHGTPDSEPMGEPRSHGCIRMRNGDVIELFDLVETGTQVLVQDGTQFKPVNFPASVLGWKQCRTIVCALRNSIGGNECLVFRDESDASARHVLIWNEEGNVAACATLSREGYLGNVVIAPAWREQGVAERLVEAALDEARRTGWKELRTVSRVEDLNFYRSRGFDPVSDLFDLNGQAMQALRCFV